MFSHFGSELLKVISALVKLIIAVAIPSYFFPRFQYLGLNFFSKTSCHIHFQTCLVRSNSRAVPSLCQRLGLTRSVRNKPRGRSASIERRRRESPPEAKGGRSESFAGGARGFAKQNRVFEHTHLPLCRPGVSIQRNHYQKMN